MIVIVSLLQTTYHLEFYICIMRLWLARIFIGLAFSLLLSHNLIVHHHDEHAVEFGADHHDHDADHTNTPFDNVKLDGDFIQKLDFQHANVCVPISLIVVLYNFFQVPVVLIQQHSTPPPDYPPLLFYVEAFALRGPPLYC